MPNAEQLALLKAGVEGWNKWREKEPDIPIDLGADDLGSRARLREADLRGVMLKEAKLCRANLSKADFRAADLSKADLSGADLGETNLRGANLNGANLRGAYLSQADFSDANLSGANLSKANLSGVHLSGVDLRGANLSGVDLRSFHLSGVDLSGANLSGVDLRRVDLRRPAHRGPNRKGAKLSGANLSGANLSGADLSNAHLSGADLRDADFSDADLSGADLSDANLSGADFSDANLSNANLSDANLNGTNLINSNLVKANITNAKISNSEVYAVNIWDLEGEFKEQKDLIITPRSQSSITVDNIKVAQFIYLLLNNKEIREVINTLTSKTVLILGRFAIPERKAILDALRDKLREYNLLPIVFDFDRPTDKDFTETIKTLAGMCYFVIADVTNPKSSPLELQATVPDYQIPFVPIIQEGEYPFAMMVDLQKKYNWVLDTISYDSLETLLEILKPHIIDPAIKKRDELRIIKAKEPTIISGKDLLSRI